MESRILKSFIQENVRKGVYEESDYDAFVLDVINYGLTFHSRVVMGEINPDDLLTGDFIVIRKNNIFSDN